MGRNKALNLLDLQALDAADELETTHRLLTAELHERIERAPTKELRAYRRATQVEIDRASPRSAGPRPRMSCR